MSSPDLLAEVRRWIRFAREEPRSCRDANEGGVVRSPSRVLSRPAIGREGTQSGSDLPGSRFSISARSRRAPEPSCRTIGRSGIGTQTWRSSPSGPWRLAIPGIGQTPRSKGSAARICASARRAPVPDRGPVPERSRPRAWLAGMITTTVTRRRPAYAGRTHSLSENARRSPVRSELSPLEQTRSASSTTSISLSYRLSCSRRTSGL